MTGQDYNLKSLRAGFKKQGLFYTPPELAEWLKSFIPDEPSEVYDPTCGRGSLLKVFPDHTKKYGQDIDGDAIRDAQEIVTNFHGAVGDVLASPAWSEKRFEAIVANPPFSIEWEPITGGQFIDAPTVPTRGRADFAFLIHILHVLSDSGTAAVLNFPGILYRGGREQVLRKWMIEQNFIDQVIQVPGGTFVDTSISTVCLVLKKSRTTDTILFVDKEHEIFRDVPISEIEKNDFSLSVSQYVAPEVKKETVNPIELEMMARKRLLNQLRNELTMSKLVAQMENIDFDTFIDEIQGVINEFRGGQAC